MNEQVLNEIIAKNISALMERYDKTQNELAEFIGVSQATVSNWCKGAKLPRMDKIDKICDFFNVPRSELMESKDNSTTYSSSSIRIPVLGSIPAGIPIEAIEDIVDWEEIPKEWAIGGKEFFSLRVTGDSMSPKYLEGDNIILHKTDDCESGDDCAVYINGYNATLKKVIKKSDHIILQPLNHNYEPMMFGYNDEEYPVKIAGIVVEIRRKV